jgi:DnaJ-class molecular chaperone
MWGGLALVLLVVGFYVVSLIFNPWVKCSKCHGKARPRAWVFGYAHHVCPKCDGTGQQLRFGRRLFRMGPGKPSS